MSYYVVNKILVALKQNYQKEIEEGTQIQVDERLIGIFNRQIELSGIPRDTINALMEAELFAKFRVKKVTIVKNAETKRILTLTIL